MIRTLTLLVVGVLAFAGPVSASPEQDRAVVEALYSRVFNGKDLSAVPELVAPNYIQHSTTVEAGRDAFVAACEGYFAAVPDLIVDVKRITTTDNLVVVHSHWRDSPSERGQAVIDIYRVENGKIAEHWDVVQPIPDGAANDNAAL